MASGQRSATTHVSSGLRGAHTSGSSLSETTSSCAGRPCFDLTPECFHFQISEGAFFFYHFRFYFFWEPRGALITSTSDIIQLLLIGCADWTHTRPRDTAHTPAALVSTMPIVPRFKRLQFVLEPPPDPSHLIGHDPI